MNKKEKFCDVDNIVEWRHIITLLLALATMTAQGQTDSTKTETKKEERKVYLHGKVADGFTKAAVPDVFVTLMRGDSTVVDTTRVYKGSNYTWGIGRTENTGYSFMIKPEPAQYILKFEHPNYETAFADVSIKHVSRRQRDIEGPNVHLKKTMKAYHFEGGELDEVVVKATKVKMVWRGDTLVYNADAFNVPEGSMLDGLIKQLPGVELTEEGEIFVNGKKIDNLTLNGADFFKGKNKVMLENLPYFTVKNVEVYNKQTPQNKYLGIDDEDKKEYTMDVVLKREYSIGGTANVEAGAGPSDGDDWRYKLKGFGLRYSDRTRAVLFGGANNINETADYDADREQYKDRSHQAGDRHFRQVGGMFTYLGPENKVNNATEAFVVWKDDSGDEERHTETFLSNSASTYGQSESHNRSRPVNIGLRNTFTLNGPWHIYSRVNLDYNRQRYDSEGWSLSAADQAPLLSPLGGTGTEGGLINSSRYRSQSRSQTVSGWGWFDVSKRLPSGDSFSLSLNGNFSRQFSPEQESENHYIYHQLGTRDDRNRLSRTPSSNYGISARLSYRYVINDLTLSPFYAIRPGHTHNDRQEYLHEAPSNLPQQGEAYALDQDNSYETNTDMMQHAAGVTISYNKDLKDKGHYGLYGSMSVNFDRQRLSYEAPLLSPLGGTTCADVSSPQGGTGGGPWTGGGLSITRHYTRYEPYAYFYYNGKGGKKRFTMNYNVSQSLPSVTDLLTRPQTSDPLNIYLANPDLQMSTTHNLDLDYTVRRDSIDQTLRFNFRGNTTLNERSNGYTYDMTTGVRTYRPENIKSGNWAMAATFVWNRALDKKKLWSIGNELRADLRRSTAPAAPLLSPLGGTTDSDASSPQGGTGGGLLSRVDNLLLRYKPSLRFQKNNLTLRLKGEVAYRNIHRNYTVGNQPTDLWDFSYGLYAQYKLPLDFTIDSDVQMHSRRGYSDAEMNDNRLYWDASLTKSLAKGRWVLKLRGYDLLGQVSNLRYSINAQGRTETWNNVLKRYAMLSVSYRFTQKPKKR